MSRKIWATSYNEVPFWQQVFPCVYFIDFWMREKYDDNEWRTMIFDDAYTTDLYADSYEGLFISQYKMLEYLDAIQMKTTCLFDNLNDENKNKASKRDLEPSRANNMLLDEKYRMISKVGEVPFDNYLRIDNTNITPEETAKMIKDAFGL